MSISSLDSVPGEHARGADSGLLSGGRTSPGIPHTLLGVDAAISWEELLLSMAPRIKEAGPFSDFTVQLCVYPKCGGESTDPVRSAI